ncbi:MAG: hypothetical protein ABWJ98_04705 [Hydrogenothermaceae bacterium]
MYKTFILKDMDQNVERGFYRFLTYFEILFFFLVLIFGFLMFKEAGYTLDQKWIKYKIFLALTVFLPLEVVNGVLVFKFMNNEKWYIIYDKFVLYISPVLVLAGVLILYFAVFKIT